MDIRQLQYYREIVKHGNISKAAEALHIAQPPLSQLLKKLELELGTVLIHRYRQKWEVTESGRLLYEYAEQLLSGMDDIKRRIGEIESGIVGTVRIGVSSACYNLLVEFIASFRDEFPKTHLEITTGDSEGLLAKLRQRDLHLALILSPAKLEEVETKKLKTQPAVLLAPESWSDKLSDKPSFEEIARLPFILLSAMEGYSFSTAVLRAFETLSLKPDIVAECKDVPLAVALVNRGLGVSIIPGMHYKSMFFNNLKIYELPKIEYQVEPILVKLKNAPVTRAAERFWGMVE